jgi:adenylate cyclase
MTYKRLKGTYRVREVDRVVVKGKTEAVGVYEVLDYHTPESFPNLSDVLQCYRDGLDQYRRQEWDKALSSLGEGLKMNPNDKLSQMYVERAQWMKANPPGNDWNGIWVLKSK